MLIFLTGATGLAGTAIAEVARRRRHSVIGVGHTVETPPPGLAKYLQIDLRDEHAAVNALLDEFPEVIINAAAISEPAKCDDLPEDSERINVRLPHTLAKLAHHLSARLIHLSTDMVFDGQDQNYAPDSPTSPTSTYGRQKLEAERLVAKHAPEFATILRTTLLTGNSLRGRRSLHEKLFAAWAAGETTPLFDDEFRQPCHASNLAEVVVEIAERNDLFGTYHWTGAETVTRHEIGRQILDHFKLPPTLIERTRIRDNPAFAGRPANLTLDIGLLAGKLKTRPLPFSEQLDTFKVPVPFRTWYHSQ